MFLKCYLPERGVDKWGSGDFLASRDGGQRKHKGVDFASPPGSMLQSPIDGDVTKIGFLYSDDPSYKYVQVTDHQGREHRFAYVLPNCNVGFNVREGDPLGMVQQISKRYPGIKDHVHWSVLKAGGTRGNADDYIDPRSL